MAIVLPGDERYPPVGTGCFLCAEPVNGGEPVAYWSGSGGSIYLHGGCVGTFVLRLARDAWEIERDAGDGKYTLELRQPGWRSPRDN